MKYIDAEKLIAEIERRLNIVVPHKDTFESCAACRQELIWMKEYIDSLQQEQPNKYETALEKAREWMPNVNQGGHAILIDIFPELGEGLDPRYGGRKQEQPEFPNGKFVFPKYLYARTKDNKTIDMSYAPQDMTAVEYIRNDFVEQKQPENKEKIMNFFDAVGDCGFSQHDILLLKNIWKETGCPPPKSQVADASKMEQPEGDLDAEFKKWWETRVSGNVNIEHTMEWFMHETARHFYELGCRRTAEMYDDIEYNRQRAEEAELSVDLEEEIRRWIHAQRNNGRRLFGWVDMVELAARHFAEWGLIHLNARKDE